MTDPSSNATRPERHDLTVPKGLPIAGRLRAVTKAAGAIVGAGSYEALRDVVEATAREVLAFDACALLVGGEPSDDPDGQERRALPAADGAPSAIRAPILGGDEVLGVLAFQSETPGLYTAEDVEVAEALASLAAAALSNFRQAEERRAAERAREVSESRFRTMFEQFPLSVQLFDPEGRTLGVNRAWEALFMLPPEAVVHFNPLHDPQLTPVREYLLRGFGGEPVTIPPHPFTPAPLAEIAAVAGERPPKWLEVTVWPIHDPEGGVREVIVVHHDVTARIEAVAALEQARVELEGRVEARTAELAQAEGRFRAIVEASPTPLLLSRVADGVILYANDRLEALIGTPPGGLVGRTTPDFYYDPADRPHVLQTIQQQGYVRDLELRIKRADGVPRWVSLTVQRLVFDGEPTLATSLLDITERKQTEQALRASEESYRGLFDNLTELVYIQDLEGRFLNVNEAVVRTYGYGRTELIGKTPDFLAAPGLVDVERTVEQFGRAVAGEPQRFDWWGLRKDGSVFPKEVAIKRSTYFGEDVVIAVGRDISDRVAAVTALRTSEEHFRRLIEHASDIITILDAGGAVRYQSPAVTRVLGYEQAELDGRNVFEFMPPEDVPPTVERLQRVVENPGTSVTAEFRFRHKDGSWRLLEGVGATLSPTSAEEGVVVNSRDITERRQAEAALRESEALKRGIVESALDCIITIDADGRILGFNPAAERTFGYRADEALGRPMVELIVPAHLREAHTAGLDRYRKTREAHVLGQRIEVPAVRADGTEFPIELAIDAVRLEDGREIFTAYLRDISERKAAEQALRQSEEHFRRLIENASDLITIIGPDGVSRYQSPSFERVLGYAPEERTGTSPFELIHPDDVEATRAVLVRMLQEPGVTRVAEFRYRHKDGSWRVFEATGRTLLPDSAEAGVVINSRDVTERKEAEAALRRSEEHFRRLIENASDIIIVVGPAGRLLYASPSLHRILGWGPEETTGDAGLDYIHPDDAEAVVREMERIGEDPAATAHLEYRFRHRDGSWRHLEAFGKRLNPHDPAAGIVFNVRDVTEREEAERRLRFQKTLLEAEGEASIDGILVVSTEGNILSYNARFVELWGIPPEVVAARSDEGAIQAVLDRLQDPEAFLARVAYLYAHPHEEARDEVTLRDGRVFDRYSAPVRSTEGDYYGRIWFFRDITAQKRHAEELEAARHEAEQARERASEYAQSLERSLEELRSAQDQLVQQEKMASLGRLTSGIAHEIKNPLNFVNNFAQLNVELIGDLRAALDTGDPALLPELLADVEQNALKVHEHGQRADAIVRGMMEHARLGADDPGQPRRPVDFNDLVEEQVAFTYGNYRRRARAALRLFRDYGDHVRTVTAVPQELARVVQGLLANALDAVEERAARERKAPPENGHRRAAPYEPTITVRTRRDGGTVTLTVSDNGIGIPEPLRHRIFEPFFTTKPTGSGHPGLGLSLAHEAVVTGYGGRLEVESTPGVVTTFTLTLPAG